MTYDRERQRVAAQMAQEQRRGRVGPMGNGPVVGRRAMPAAPEANVPRTLAATNIAARETMFPTDTALEDGPMPSGFEAGDGYEEPAMPIMMGGLAPSRFPDERPPPPEARTDLPAADTRDAASLAALQEALTTRERRPRRAGDTRLDEAPSVGPRGMRTLAATNIAAHESLAPVLTPAQMRRLRPPSGFEPAD